MFPVAGVSARRDLASNMLKSRLWLVAPHASVPGSQSQQLQPNGQRVTSCTMMPPILSWQDVYKDPKQ